MIYNIRILQETGSTNEDAKVAAKAGEPEGLVIQAYRQTGGKGRQGRTWSSPEGNLYVSILLRPHCDLHVAGLYSFVVALAVYDTIKTFLPHAEVQIKWPNDVLVNGKKISGILLETAPLEEGKVSWLVLGTGINLASHPIDALYPVTDIRSQGAENINLSGLLETYLENFEKGRQTLLKEGFDSLRQVWIERARKGAVVARLPKDEIKGEFVGLDDLGRLLLKLPDGTERAISAADIFFET